MHKSNVTIISIIVAVILVAAIAIIWGMRNNAPAEDTTGALVPTNADGVPLSGTPEEVDQINIDDIENELKGLDQDIEQL